MKETNSFDAIRCFGLLLVSSALMEYVPSNSITTYVFSAFLVLLILNINFKLLKDKFKNDPTCIIVTGFIGLVLISTFVAILNDIEFYDAIRGAIPFLFLLIYIALPNLHYAQACRLIKYLIISSIVWAMRILIELFYLVYNDQYNFSARLTGQIYDSVIPYTIACLPFLVTKFNSKPIKKNSLVAMILICIVVLAGYRSQTLIVIVELIVSFLYNIRNRTITVRGFILVSSAFFVIALFLSNSFENVIDRFTLTSSEYESSRIAEIEYSLQSFYKNPIFGNGIGFYVPYYVTFSGSESQLIASGFEMPDRSGYIHNLTLYLLMDMGLIGLITYSAIFISAYRSYKLCLCNFNEFNKIKFISIVSLLSLLLYCQVQASFRLIHVNLFFVTLLCLITARNSDTK